MGIKRRLERLEAVSGVERVVEEPDWPRPFKDVSLEVLEAVSRKEIRRYVEAVEGGTEHRQSYAECYAAQEAFHEARWRQHGIRCHNSGMPAPEDWREVEQVLLEAEEYTEGETDE
jgi:hypothetical protein